MWRLPRISVIGVSYLMVSRRCHGANPVIDYSTRLWTCHAKTREHPGTALITVDEAYGCVWRLIKSSVGNADLRGQGRDRW